MLISIAIAAHNRPEFLLEAARSIATQGYRNFEVIVIDDGSSPPISEASLKEVLGDRVRLYRHESAQGVPKAKNAGIRAASGEVILILDDDDRLAPNALECVFRAFSGHPEIDCLFMGVRAFGRWAENALEGRNKSMRTVLETSRPDERDGLYFFSERLFTVLLRTVPIDFQRPAARRCFWNLVGCFDENAQYSESAWTIHASCKGQIALSKEPLQEWRIHGDNYSWPNELETHDIVTRQLDNEIMAGANLLKTFNTEEDEWHRRGEVIRRYYSDLLFSKAYHLRGRQIKEGLKALYRSFLLAPRLSHVKLALTFLLPQWRGRGAGEAPGG